LAAATKLELYCDPRYVNREVITVGRLDKPAEAGEVLDALRVSLSATWRKVGPAYVLTNDLVGIGARRHAINAAVRKWTDGVSASVDKADRDLVARSTKAGCVCGVLHVTIDIPSIGHIALRDIVPARQMNPKPSDLGSAIPEVIEPGSADEAVKAIDDAGGTVYLNVFRNGDPYWASKSLTPSSPFAAAVLPAALAEARAKGVKLYAVVDLLKWGGQSDTETSLAWRGRVDEDLTVDGHSSPDGDHWVSPTDPRVSDILSGLLRELGSTPGLAGIVFRDVAAPGYYTPSRQAVELGYSESMRLAYLRSRHEDPIDVDNPLETQVTLGPRTVDLDVAGFDSSTSPEQDMKAWRVFRRSCQQSLVTDLIAAFHQANPSIDVYVDGPGPSTKDGDH